MHENSLKNLEGTAEANSLLSSEQKERFLQVIEQAAFNQDKVRLPNISHVLRGLNIPRGTYTNWLQKDKTFRERYDSAMEAFDDAALKSLFDSNQEKWGVAYAATWLKYRGKLRDRVEHTGQISQIHLVSRVREEPVLSTDN